MITEVWLHRFNNNELGISEEGTGRGAFVLVPQDARKLLPSLSEENEFRTTVNVYVNKVLLGDNNYSKPPSKSEYRLSLAGIDKYSGHGKFLSGGQSVVIHGYNDGVNISTDLPNETIEPYLREFSSRTSHNNTALSITHEVTGSTGDVVKNTLSKPFILLAGISGTGKSRFVREQAKSCWETEEERNNLENFELVSVRPDWHDPSDLLGYISRLGKGGSEYVVTDVLTFIVKAWKAINPSNDELKKSKFSHKETSPYWLCLDEMNLAPVEQYFADYLSVLETRKWKDGFYSCDPILKSTEFSELDEAALDKLRHSLGFADEENEEYQELWKFFIEKGIPLPYNLIVAGTVNMDETTHGFSRKVIDRALTLDFGDFYPNNFDKYGLNDIKPISLSYPLMTHVFTIDESNQKLIETREFLKQINSVLKGTMFELAYRALNEALLMVESIQPLTAEELCAVWDDFLMMKVLPRIEGDDDKLAYIPDSNSKELITILDKLREILSLQLGTLENADSQEESNIDDSGEADISITDLSKRMLNPIWESGRPDLLNDGGANISCRSKQKLEWMIRKLNRNSFTTFWP